MRVTNDRKIGEVGKRLFPASWCQFTIQHVPTQDLCYLKIKQVRGVQRLAGFEKSRLNIGRRGRSQ